MACAFHGPPVSMATGMKNMRVTQVLVLDAIGHRRVSADTPVFNGLVVSGTEGRCAGQ